jgi:hypothetical protein
MFLRFEIQGEKKQIFAHPAVKALLLDYFFTGRNSDGFYDIESFGPTIPLPTIALVITVVSSHCKGPIQSLLILIYLKLKVCLDEWADGSGTNLDFSMGIYQKVYLTALKFLNKASEDPKYKDYMQNLCEKWFKAGRSIVIFDYN